MQRRREQPVVVYRKAEQRAIIARNNVPKSCQLREPCACADVRAAGGSRGWRKTPLAKAAQQMRALAG